MTRIDIDHKLLERVRKLLAKAEHPGTPPAEAEAFSAKASALMAQHAIARAMVDGLADDTTQTPETRQMVVLGPYALPRAVLLTRVADAHRVRVVIGPDRSDGGKLCTAVGFRIDLDITELLFTSLLLQASTAMSAASAGHPRPKAFRRAFLLGYASSIGERLARVRDEAVREASAGTPSAALVLADRRHAVDAAIDEQFPHLRSIRPTISSGGGLAAGRDAGRRADLSAGRGRMGSAGMRRLPAAR